MTACFYLALQVLLIASSSIQGEEENGFPNVALLRPADQSSTFASADATLAVDGNPETCSVTKADSQRWWSVQLPKAVNVQEVSVVLNQGLAFHQEFTVFVIGTTGDNRSQFHKCAKFAGILREQRQVLRCNPREGIAGEKVYIRDDRRQGTLSLCEVEVKAQAGGICSEPPKIDHGRAHVLGGTQQQLRYFCDPGFLLWGQPDLVCGANNTWSSKPPQCKPLTCGYPHVEDAHAIVEKSSYNIEQSLGAGIGEEASLVCQAGFQMVISNSSGNRVMEVVDRIRVVCNQEGMWEKPFHYYCHNATWTKTRMLQPSSKDSSLSLQTIAYTLLSIIFFLLLFLLLTFVLRWKRMKVRKKRTELTRVTMPRIHSETNLTGKKPLISIFTTMDPQKKNSSASTTSLVSSQHLQPKLMVQEDAATLLGPSAEGRRPMSYEEDLQLPESGSLVQCISVDPHSAVFGRNGLRLDHQQEQQQQVLTPPDVTGDYLKYGRRSASFLSSFQSPSHKDEANTTTSTTMAVAAAAASFWANGGSNTKAASSTSSSPMMQPIFSTSFSTASIVQEENNMMVLQPPALFSGQFTSGELPELDEAGYASLVLRTVAKSNNDPEPVYERIKGERPSSQEILNGGENVSDSESHAYYSRVAKDVSLEPPPLKEHLYQNFDQVFLAMEEQHNPPAAQRHPDLLENMQNEQYYENTHSLSSSSPKEIVVNDEKLRNMYAQVDVVKKHFDRSHRAYHSLQVIDRPPPSSSSSQEPPSPPRLAWEEQI